MSTLKFAGHPTAGLVVDLYLGVGSVRRKALSQTGKFVPVSLGVRALVDTGSSRTVVEEKFLIQLGLAPVGETLVSTASTGATPILRACRESERGLKMGTGSGRTRPVPVPIFRRSGPGKGGQAPAGYSRSQSPFPRPVLSRHPLRRIYRAKLFLAGAVTDTLAENLDVIAADDPSGVGVDMLLGRDILGKLHLHYDGPNDEFTLEIP